MPIADERACAMERSCFEAFQEIVYARSGIALREGKESMVSARIGKRMRALGLQDHRDYLRLVQDDASGDEIVHLLDAISTNVTKFFRESEHFGFLAHTVGKWLKAGQRRFRFWSAACSSGEEPYSMAMTLAEAFRGYEVDVRILATDISTRVLEKCRRGEYPSDKVGDVPESYLQRHFERRGRGDEETWCISEATKRMVLFKRLNLAEPPFPMQGPMDMIFCRNVMIYFDNDVRRALLAEAHRLLKPGGYLMVGHAESLTGMMSELKTVVPSIYVKG